MDGVALETFVEPLTYVPDAMNARPIKAIEDLTERLGPYVHAYIVARFNDDYNIEEMSHHLPMKAFGRLTFDDICKIKYSSIYTMDQTFEDAFTKEPEYEIVHKITSSMWRWGVGHNVWNEVVDAYDAIRSFTVPIPGMEVRLDYTTGYNECGGSRYSRTYLDGVFAFLLYYRGEHVMTLGFSVAEGRKLLLQQVQLKNRRKNRWLFKLPENRMEYFIGLFRNAFPKHSVYVVDGAEIAGKSLDSYGRGLEKARVREGRAREALRRDSEHGKWHEDSIVDALKDQAAFRELMEHLSAEIDRIAAFYADVGRYKRGKPVKVNGITHYEIA